MKSSLVFLVVVLMVSGFLPQAFGSQTNVESRISSAIEYLIGQQASGNGIEGFVRGTAPPDSQRMYTADAGLVALALSFYMQTHPPIKYYENLRVSIDFLMHAQTESGDFREYFSTSNSTWGSGGRFYYWNAYALLGASYAAFILQQASVDTAYWSGVVNGLRKCVETWMPQNQVDGGVGFYFPDGSVRADIAANGAMLVALMHIALFEFYSGDGSIAARYARWAEEVATWLRSRQETSKSSWGWGGFYMNGSRLEQDSYENGLAMFGLDSYYEGIGLISTNFAPTIDEARSSMINWAEGFGGRMLDTLGGPSYARFQNGSILYPKTVSAAASITQAMVDIWINIGTHDYWTDASRVYEWLTGSNGQLLDLQTARNIQGVSGGFYFGLSQDGLIPKSDLGISALATYALVRASFVTIPEFGQQPIAVLIPLLLALVIFKRRRLSGDNFNAA
jgi:hypothetical protein